MNNIGIFTLDFQEFSLLEKCTKDFKVQDNNSLIQYVSRRYDCHNVENGGSSFLLYFCYVAVGGSIRNSFRPTEHDLYCYCEKAL